MGGVILLFCALFAGVNNASAQDSNETKKITSWHGGDVTNFVYTHVDHQNKKVLDTPKPTKFYLYNVGTGKFVAIDGEYGLRPYLKYRSHGAAMTLGYSTATPDKCKTLADGTTTRPNVIYAGIPGFYEKVGDRTPHPYALGVNLPNRSSDSDWDNMTQSFGPIYNTFIEAAIDGSGDYPFVHRHMHFVRVDEDKDPEGTFTYRIFEELYRKEAKNGEIKIANWYWGAQQGQNEHDKNITKHIYTDGRVTFYINNIKYTEFVDQGKEPATNELTGSDFYKWRFVTEEEMREVVEAQDADQWGGLLANTSYTIDDPYFDTNRSDEYDSWKIEPYGTKAGDTEYRYDWTGRYGDSYNYCERNVLNCESASSTQKGYFTKSGNWDKPELYKIHFDTKDDAKYSYVLLNGAGKVYQDVVLPEEGYYMVTLKGISHGKAAQLFATSGQETQTAELYYDNDNKFDITTFDSEFGVRGAKVGDGWLGIGKDQTFVAWNKREDYDVTKIYTDGTQNYNSTYFRGKFQYVERQDTKLHDIGFEFYKENDDTYNAEVVVKVGSDGKLRIGVQKENVDQQTVQTHMWEWVDGYWYWDGIIRKYKEGYWPTDPEEESYYYDKSFAAFDNVNIYYMGKEEPFLLDEEATSQSYIEEHYTKGKADKDFQNNTVYMKRSFVPNIWNTFMSPVRMTYEQVQAYFGDDTKLAEFSGVNTITSSDTVYLDFKTKKLFTTSELGNMPLSSATEGYAIEPGKMYIIKPGKTSGTDLYQFNDAKPLTYMIGRHDFYNNSMPEKGGSKGLDQGDKKARVYAMTGGTFCAVEADAEGAPIGGDYIFATDGNMYHLDSSIAMKGFRAWINGSDKTGTITGDGAKVLSFGFDIIGSTTYIDGVLDKPAEQTNNVYTLNGQLVRLNAQNLNGLKSGVYVVNGRKVVVK